jgi:TatD DNase family protein
MEQLYDTHFHLDLQKDRASAIREIEERQIYTIAVTNLPDLYRKESAEIASKFIRFALGFHPEIFFKYKSQVSLMWDLLPEASYIGEVGLDYTDIEGQKEQAAFFSELVDRCRYDSKKIMTIHSRRAVGNVLDILGDNYRFKAILHWFIGSDEELRKAIELGCYFSVNGAMMKSKRFLDMLPLIPSNRILLETDSPFTFFTGTHYETLRSINEYLKTYKPEVDVWSNFRRLLE